MIQNFLRVFLGYLLSILPGLLIFHQGKKHQGLLFMCFSGLLYLGSSSLPYKSGEKVFEIVFLMWIIQFLYLLHGHLDKKQNKKEISSLDSNKNEKFKKEEELFSKILIGYFISFITITYIMPDNILEVVPLLSNLVQMISIIAPTVKRWGIYSTHSQVTQLVYSLGIISIPFVSYTIFRKCLYPRIPISFKKDESFSVGIATFLCFLGSFLGILMVFFIYPFPMKTHRILLDIGHFSMIGFAIGSAIYLEATSLLIAASTFMVIYRKRLKISQK